MSTSSEPIADSRAFRCGPEGLCTFAVSIGGIVASRDRREAAAVSARTVSELMGARRVEVLLAGEPPLAVLGEAEPENSEDVVRVAFDAPGPTPGSLVAWGCDVPGAAKGLQAVAAILESTLFAIDGRECLGREVESRDRYFSAFSHEIRTPLTAIRSLSEVLLTEDDPAVAREYVSIVHEEAVRLARLVNRNLELDKLKAGRERLFKTEWPPAELLRSAEKSVRSQSADKAVTVKIDAPEDLPEFLLDRDRIVQVLVNLLRNAVRFSPEGGTVAIEARIDPTGLRMSVIDSGPGIAAADREAVFERYRQLDDGDQRGGTGLGLAICREIVEAHGGRIGVHDADGGGAAFEFTLPIRGSTSPPA